MQKLPDESGAADRTNNSKNTSMEIIYCCTQSQRWKAEVKKNHNKAKEAVSLHRILE